MKKIFSCLFFLLGISIHSIFPQSASSGAKALDQMIKYVNSANTDSAYLVTESSINNLELKNNPKFWFYSGLIYKEMYKKYEKGNTQSSYREKSSQSYQKSLAMESDPDIITDIKKNLKFLATTYYNDAIRLLKEDKPNVTLSIYTFNQYIELMKTVDENFDFKQKGIEFSLALGSVYAKMFEKEDNVKANEYYELAKKCYENVLELDPSQSSARYNLVVLETNFKTKQEILLKEESDKKDKEILSLNAIKELSEVKLHESELEDEANKKGLLILKNQQEKYEMRVKSDQERKDAVIAKEKQDQKILLWSVLSGLFIVLAITGIIFRGFRQKQKANKIILEQKEEVEKSYHNTKLLSEIGQQITASLSVDDITQKVYSNVNQLMDASAFGIGIFDSKEEYLGFSGFIEKGETLPFSFDLMKDDNRLSVLCFKNKQEIFINDLEKEYNIYFPGQQKPNIIVGESPESIIYLILSVTNKTIGVITVQSFRKNAYTDYNLNILRNLAVNVSIALDNSGAYNELNTTLTELKEIEEQLRQKNKDITDSILYAKRIQESILPSKSKIQELHPDSFILYQPKDIVSGDFYWMDGIENNSKIVIAAVDCTGHGVPGALLTVIGNNLLNHIVNEMGISRPKDVLREMNTGIINRFNLLEDSFSREGMDISLISIERTKETTYLHFSGAYNSLFLLRNNELIVLEAMRQHIGNIPVEMQDNILQHTIEIMKGDMVYIFSDGYADQINDKTGKKFMKGKFKDLLLDIHKKSMYEQKNILEKKHKNWRGDTFQTDDILVMGFQF